MKASALRQVTVRLRFASDDVREVGQLAERGREVWFEYAPSFIAGGLELSPLKLPLRAGLVQHTISAGAPIPGVFNDARPDGWGLKLLHRSFQTRGRAASAVSPLDELALAAALKPGDGGDGDAASAGELGLGEAPGPTRLPQPLGEGALDVAGGQDQQQLVHEHLSSDGF